MDIIERLGQNIAWLTRDGFETSAKNLNSAKKEIESLRQQLAAALAACEAKDAAFRKIVRMGNHLDVLSMCMPAHEALAIKPDASALKAHDDALIEKIEYLVRSHWNPHKQLDREQQISNEVVDYIIENVVKFRRCPHEPKTTPSASGT